MRVGSLFSGIGGLDLGLERAGMKVVWQVENDPYCNKVLAKHWPGVPRYGDIKEIDFTTLPPVDLICGGFPCQPVSCAGKRQGDQDERWLWPEFYRAVCEVRPGWVLVENVPGLLSAQNGRLFGGILGDLARSGYDAEWDLLPAAAFGAPHLRFRLFIVAYPHEQHGNGSGFHSGQVSQQQKAALSRSKKVANPKGKRRNYGPAENVGAVCGKGNAPGDSGEILADSKCNGLQGEIFSELGQGTANLRRRLADSDWWELEPDVGRVANGIPSRVDRLKCLGNAVVPQVAEWIGKRIMEAL